MGPARASSGCGGRHASPPASLIAMWVVLLAFEPGSANQDIVTTFNDPINTDHSFFNHLAIDEKRQVFIGAVNRLYQLTPDLEVIQQIHTDSGSENTTLNVNKVLLIDQSSLVMCGTGLEGTCSVRNLNNLKHSMRAGLPRVVAQDPSASAAAVLAPGPWGSNVMYVGTSASTLSSDIGSAIPAVSSRSLEDNSLFELASIGDTTATQIFVNNSSRQNYPINYVYGFSSGSFSYFLTTQLRAGDSDTYYSKLVRVSHGDADYYSYTEIPISCSPKDDEKNEYNLAQAAFYGQAGYQLARDLNMDTYEDILFVTFSKSESRNTSKPSNHSALCMYSLQMIREKFVENIKMCYSGKGSRGLDFISPSQPCIDTKMDNIPIDFSGSEVNSPLGGEVPVKAAPIAEFSERLTALAAATVGDFTALFAGTAGGHLKSIVVENATFATEYADVAVDEGSPVNKDLLFDRESKHLYVMTERKVSKVKVQGDCSVYESCLSCFKANNPYCGWITKANKCGLLSESQDANNTPLAWISYRKARCSSITQVNPNQLQITTRRTLNLSIDFLPYDNTHYECEFRVLNNTISTKALPKYFGLNCSSPLTDELPAIPPGAHQLTVDVSVRTTTGPSFLFTNVTYFDCRTYESCTECVSSPFPCDWCVDGNRCTHDTSENCRNDILVTGVSNSGPSYRSGPGFCPTIESILGGTGPNEIIVPFGEKKAIRAKVKIIGQFIVQTRFVCQFIIEGRLSHVNGQLLGDTIYCDAFEFTYESSAPRATAAFGITWGGTKLLDNPGHAHILITR